MKYMIKRIHSDGYERVAMVKGAIGSTNLSVHFLEYDEYLESDGESKKKKVGDWLEGELFIGLVTNTKKVDKELVYYQEIQNSPHIEAIVEVSEVIDEYSVYALSTILDMKILIEFEVVTNYKVGDRIFVVGSLEMVEKSWSAVEK